jgi:hypothetical protein
MVMTPGVLYARRTSVYKTLHADVYDEDRDARTWHRLAPVVAHPPCRSWGRLAVMAKPIPGELELAIHAVRQVQRCGGVLEHPAWSALWTVAFLPLPGRGFDAHGGWTLSVDQSWWGHRAAKPTWLYIVGVSPNELPPMPFHLGTAPGRIEMMGKAEREATPPAFAAWLLDVVRLAW